MGFFVVTFIILALFSIIVKPLTLLIRELGHAIPVMLLTRQGATIYIGAYGDPHSIKIPLGPLKIYITYNIFRWRGGSICQPNATTIKYVHKLIYILGGSILSIIVAFTVCYFVVTSGLHGAIKLVSVLGVFACLIDLRNNLRVSFTKEPDGLLLLSDGATLQLLFKGKNFYHKYELATQAYFDGKFKEAGILFMELVNKGHGSQFLYRWTADAFYQDEDFDRCHEVMKAFAQKYVPEQEDYLLAADAAMCIGLNEEQTKYFEMSLKAYPNDVYLMNSIGYRLNFQGRFEEAIPYFNTAIGLELSFAEAYSNRGHAKIEAGRPEEGLADVKRSLELDSNNPYAYKSLGIYHLAKNEKEEALKLFTKAREMGAMPYWIDDYIQKSS